MFTVSPCRWVQLSSDPFPPGSICSPLCVLYVRNIVFKHRASDWCVQEPFVWKSMGPGSDLKKTQTLPQHSHMLGLGNTSKCCKERWYSRVWNSGSRNGHCGKHEHKTIKYLQTTILAMKLLMHLEMLRRKAGLLFGSSLKSQTVCEMHNTILFISPVSKVTQLVLISCLALACSLEPSVKEIFSQNCACWIPFTLSISKLQFCLDGFVFSRRMWGF